MNAKKFLALLLAMVLCFGVLAGCNPTVDPTEPSGDNNVTDAPTDGNDDVALKNADVYPIDFDGSLTAVTAKTNADKAANWLLIEELTGVDIDWQVTASDQTPLLFTTGKESLPDIFWWSAGLSSVQVKEYGKKGLILNVMDLLDKMPNLKAMYEADPKIFDAVRDSEGAVYYLPTYTNTLTMSGNLFYVRTDMAKEAGWEKMPATVEEFLQMCEDLKKQNADVDGFVPMLSAGPGSVGYTGAYANFFFPAFGELMSPTLAVTPDGKSIGVGFATEQYKNYITFMHELYEKGYLDDECFEAESATTKALMIEGKAAMHPSASFMKTENFASGEMDMTLMNPLTSRYQSEARWLNANPYGGCHSFITANCSDVDAACALFDALYAPRENPLNKEGTAWGVSMWLGVMGKDFKLNEEDGSYEILPHDGFDTGANWLLDASNGGAAVTDWPYYENSGTGLMVKAVGTRDVLRPHGVDAIQISVLQLTEDEQDIYNDAWTDINKHVVEMNAAFITGQKDIEAEWDTYVKTLEDYGLQDAIDVYQAALDRYNAK